MGSHPASGVDIYCWNYCQIIIQTLLDSNTDDVKLVMGIHQVSGILYNVKDDMTMMIWQAKMLGQWWKRWCKDVKIATRLVGKILIVDIIIQNDSANDVKMMMKTMM